MSLINEVETTITEVDQKINDIKMKLVACLESLPENEKIKVISVKPLAYTTMFSQLRKHDNWCPFFHSFLAQYTLLIRLINGEVPVMLELVNNGLDVAPRGSKRVVTSEFRGQGMVEDRPAVEKSSKGMELSTIIKMIKEIVDKGSWLVPQHKHRYHFHPEVRAELAKWL